MYLSKIQALQEATCTLVQTYSNEIRVPQALIYLQWVRYAIEIVLCGRSYVVLNMDETSLSSVEDQGKGMRTCRRGARGANTVRRRDSADRSNTKTTLVATVCDNRDLQPYLPQIVLARYTQQGAPPAALAAAYAASGEPLEYWHRTGGFATSNIIKKWAVRVRSIVHSFNPEAWILLVWDCSQVHLNEDVARHLRRLGILAIVIPAKLTWLLQVLDVCDFKLLKTRVRMEKTSMRCRDPEGRLRAGAWIGPCAAAIREVIVDRCHEDLFERMGLGDTIDSITGRVRRVVHPEEVHPRLPTRSEFGVLTNRPNHDTPAFRTLHALMMGHFMAVQQLPPDALPPRGALVPLPVVPAARKRFRMGDHAGLNWEAAMDREVEQMAADRHRQPHGRRVAVQRDVRPAEVD